MIPALRKQRQADLCEFEVSLFYKASSRTGSKATEKHCFGKQNKTKKSKPKQINKKSIFHMEAVRAKMSLKYIS